MSTHEELMTALKFDESFRNALRNYYSYGFKKVIDYDQEKLSTIKNDWERLNNLLSGYLKWSNEHGKDAVMFATQNSAMMDDNPFHRLYKFCKFNYNDPVEFFNILIGLSDKFRISGSDKDTIYKRLGIDLVVEAKKRPYYRYIKFIKQNKNSNIMLRRADSVYALVATHNSEKNQMIISKQDIKLVESLLEIWRKINKDVEPSDSLLRIENKLYVSILDMMDISLLNSVIINVCDKYIDFIVENVENDIKIKRHGSKYKIEALGKINCIVEFSKRDFRLIERLLSIKSTIALENPMQLTRNCIKLLGVSFVKTVFERNHKKLVFFFMKNVDKHIYIENQEKKNYQLFVDEQNSIVVPRKDEKYVCKLFGYWNFIKRHTDIQLSGISEVETSKKRHKKKVVLIGTTDNGKIETFDIPISSLDDREMVQRLIVGDIDLYEKTFLANEVSFLDDMFGIMSEAVNQNRGLLASQLQCFIFGSVGLFCGDNTAINYRLSGLENLNIIEKISSEENSKKISENVWKLRGRTLSELLKKGNDICSNGETDFERTFYNAIDFYSKYYVLGVCGSFIKDRMNRFGTDYLSVYRFKHEYFMQALNDFNLVDLLYVIENNKWCEIQYSHGTAEFSSKILCKPLEIRISSTSGREFLVFYNPIKRSCTNLRLEFIEEIITYEREDVIKALEKNNIFNDMIDADITNIRETLKSMWGVSFSAMQEGNAIFPVELKDVKLIITYDNKVEYYIRNRILRESRGTINKTSVNILPDKGIITFNARVSDPKEMRPWIRSLYSRLINVEGIETETFSLLSDIEKCIAGIMDLREEKLPEPKRWVDNTATLGRIANGEKVRAHELLFNEVFGVYYYIIAEIILLCCSEENRTSMPKKQIDDIIKKVGRWYINKGGNKTFRLSMKEISRLLKNNVFGKNFEFRGEKRTQFRYECGSEIKFYKDVLPLTTLEVRWLKTIIYDTDMHYFLNKEQIMFISSFLDDAYPDVKSLQIENLVFYDRYMVNQSEKKAERSYIQTFVKAITNKKLIIVTYITNAGNKICKKFKPIVIEYSKRNNKFQVQLKAYDNNKFYSVNLSQISCVKLEEEEFDYIQVLNDYELYCQDNERQVVIQFYEVRNMTDRILTEFSPWRKYCVYDPIKKVYTLTLYYHKNEELDMVVRLMGYGGNIHFVDREHSIAREILKRYTIQKKIILNRKKLIEWEKE